MKLLFLILIFFSQHLVLYGQINFSKSLDNYLNNESIKENHIQSLVIYAEFNEHGIDKSGGYGGKLAEFEFDNNGCEIYKLISDNHGNLPFIEYGGGSVVEISEYDENSQRTSNYTESNRKSRQEIFTYNNKGKKTSFQYINNNDTIIKIAFKWEKDVMIEANSIYVNETNKNRVHLFNKKGRILKTSSGDWSTNYDYEQKGDTLITTITTYQSDTLLKTQKSSTLLKFNRIIYYEKKDHSGKTVIEMNAELDENGNSTYYYVNNLTEIYSNNKAYPPSHYRITNVYDKRNLLTKRMYYYSREDIGMNKLIKIERYFYDSGKLPFKITKGSLIERDEFDMMDSIDK